METRECHLCHRIGQYAFVPYGDWAWRCLHESPASGVNRPAPGRPRWSVLTGLHKARYQRQE